MTKFELINKNVDCKAFSEIKKIVSKRLTDRNCKICAGDIKITFALDETLEKDSYAVTGEAKNVVVSADCLINLYAGIGRYMILGLFDCKGEFEAPELPIKHKMKKSLRGMYFATHFYNYHHVASEEEVFDSIADLALKGYNSLACLIGIQHYESYHDPDAQDMIARVKLELNYCAKLGMKPAMVTFTNTGYHTVPAGLEAQTKMDDSGRYRRDMTAEFITEICPSKPEGMAEIERQHRDFFEFFKDTRIDYIICWAYDEGGCLCEKCYPWVTNGFIKVVELDRKLLKEYGYDKTEIILSTWHFMNLKLDEWDIFYEKLAVGEYSYASYIMTAFQAGFPPKVIKDNGVPKGVRFIDFPDISMRFMKTWGGFGANPIPMFLDAVEENCGDYHDGGYPYSEGVYENINEFICANFYCGYHKRSADAMKDYFRFEYGIVGEDAEKLVKAAQLMEMDLSGRKIIKNENGEPWVIDIGIVGGAAAPEVYRLVTAVEPHVPEALSKGWKWRCFYLRAVVDYRIYINRGVVKYDEEAQAAFQEIRDMFHLQNAKFCVSTLDGK